MQAATNQLQAVIQEAGAAMYQQGAGPEGGAAPNGDSAGSDEDVIEGEFSDA